MTMQDSALRVNKQFFITNVGPIRHLYDITEEWWESQNNERSEHQKIVYLPNKKISTTFWM